MCVSILPSLITVGGKYAELIVQPFETASLYTELSVGGFNLNGASLFERRKKRNFNCLVFIYLGFCSDQKSVESLCSW